LRSLYNTKESQFLHRLSLAGGKNEELLFVSGHNSRRGEVIILS